MTKDDDGPMNLDEFLAALVEYQESSETRLAAWLDGWPKVDSHADDATENVAAKQEMEEELACVRTLLAQARELQGERATEPLAQASPREQLANQLEASLVAHRHDCERTAT